MKCQKIRHPVYDFLSKLSSSNCCLVIKNYQNYDSNDFMMDFDFVIFFNHSSHGNH